MPNRVMSALAFLALAFAIVVPPGFMTAARTDGLGFSIVICTGHGPLQLGQLGDPKAPPGKSKASTSCPFAANLTPPLPAIFAVKPQIAPFGPMITGVASDQIPGRGLAAPPPPATGPPALI